MKNVCFVYKYETIPTSQIRGLQVAAALGADTLTLAELSRERAGRYRVVVYVKEVPTPDTMARIRDGGVRQVWDPLDRFDWRTMRRHARYVDAFLAANRTHAIELERRYGLSATLIPHQHCNADELTIPRDRTPPTLGFIGGRDHWPLSRRLVRRLPYEVFSTIHTPAPVVDAYLGVDIGFAYREDRHKLSYNAATKLVNFMSFGIPAVLNPETGYLEVSRHDEACLYAQSKREFVRLLERLAADPVLRRRLGEAGIEAARPYHIRAVAEQYRAFLESLP